MIPNQWYPVLESRSLRRRPVGLKRMGREVVLWRRDGALYCLPDRCPHRAAKLSRGRIVEGNLQCPYHGFVFDGAGNCVLIPANGRDAPVPNGFDLDPIPVREEQGLIWLWHGERRESYPDLPWFSDVSGQGGATATVQRVLNINYLRVMENAGDVHHFPFVHRSMSPGVGPLVVDFESSSEGEEIILSGALAHDDPAKRRFPFRVRIRMPSLVSFDVLPGLNFTISATPIDAEHTWLWGRYSQSYLPAALGGRLLSKLVGTFDFMVTFVWQDLPVLRSQQLGDPSDISGYHLIPADRAVAQFFSLRHRLLREAKERPPENP